MAFVDEHTPLVLDVICIGRAGTNAHQDDAGAAAQPKVHALLQDPSS
jgi:hypothetical protein